MTEAPGNALRILKLYTNVPFTHTGSHLRGSLIGQFPDRERLHNHSADGKPTSPKVRYLVREKVPCVVGVDLGREDLLDMYSDVEELRAHGRVYEVIGKELLECPLGIETASGLRCYEFGTPWIALNQANHARFLETTSDKGKRELLEGIAIGNFLTAARYVGVTFPPSPKIEVRITAFSFRPLIVAGKELLGFKATFVSNIRWNLWIGLGKMVSKGFGLLELVE